MELLILADSLLDGSLLLNKLATLELFLSLEELQFTQLLQLFK